MTNCTYIHGIGSSAALDTAGEVVDIEGMDISSLIGGAINWEHESKQPTQVVGKILEAHKIFNEKDCQNEHHLFFWNKIKIPFLYVMGRLFDDKKPSSKEVAALFQDNAEHPQEPDIIGFSIEGAKIEKRGAVITRSIARKLTCTVLPANKTCVGTVYKTKIEEKTADPLSQLFKGEMELFKFEPTYEEIMEKKENLKKDVGSGGGAFIGSQLAMSEKMNKSLTGKFMTFVPGGHIAHPSKTGEAHLNHDWDAYYAGPGKQHTHNPSEAMKFNSHDEAKAHMAEQHNAGKVKGNLYQVSQHDDSVEKSELKKALDAGSMNAAPGQLAGGAALGKESLERRSQKVNSLQKKEKSHWYERADQAYQSWDKKEHFRQYMKKRMPHLADGEVDAIGRILALKKNMQAEGKLNGMYARMRKNSHVQKGSDVMMASEKDKKK